MFLLSFRKVSAFALLLLFTLCVKADVPLRKQMRRDTKEYIAQLYRKIDFCNSGKLDPKVFAYAYKGYIGLLEAGKLNEDKAILSIVDYSLSSNVYRLWVIDLDNYKVLFNTYVAHGQGSGEEFANTFSNRPNSHQSSLGFYVTGDTYQGEHGLSLYLHGMDARYNSAAYSRYIVVHAADYVSKKFIDDNQRLGRSWGCPALPLEVSDSLIHTIERGTCLFAFYPDAAYLARSSWLKVSKPTSVFVQEELADKLMSGEDKADLERTINSGDSILVQN